MFKFKKNDNLFTCTPIIMNGLNQHSNQVNGYVCTMGNEFENFENTPSGNFVIGVNGNNDVYYSNANVSGPSVNPTWQQINGQSLVQVSGSNGAACGVDKEGSVYYLANVSSTWVNINGASGLLPNGLKQVSFDGIKGNIMGIDSAGKIYYANANITTNPNWTSVMGRLRSISLSNNQAMGVGNDGFVYYTPNYSSGNWLLFNTLKTRGQTQISFDGYNNIALVLNYNNVLYYTTGDFNKTFSNPSWKQINNPAVLKSISLSNKRAYATDNESKIWYCDDITSGKWVNPPDENNWNRLAQVSFQ